MQWGKQRAHRIKPAAIITAGRARLQPLLSVPHARSLSHSSLIPRTSALSLSRSLQYVGLPNTYSIKGCNDDTWPDGEGSFHGDGATPYGMDELVRRMDMLDWTEGFTIRTARIGETECTGTHQLGACYPELQMDKGRTDSFG